MAAEPVLSICVPSRNRQIYFQETVRALTASPRRDVEFVLVDNSDDAEIMRTFMAPLLVDSRIRFLPSPLKTLSMMDNWERAVSAATGRWVVAMGDDDYVDPELVDLILKLEAHDPEADALAWTGMTYIWPEPGSPIRPININMSARITRFDKNVLMRKAFKWEGAAMVPLCGYSIYHGAHSRRLINRIRELGRGRYFEFPIIDYENAFKAILLGKNFYHSSRPFSVLGVCPLSNSKASGSLEAQDRAQANFNRELGWNLDDDPLLADIPFRTNQGLTACVYAVQHWLTRKYKIPHVGFEENLIKAMEANCRLYPDRASFEITADRYRTALAQWKGGTWLSAFDPVWQERPAPVANREMLTGLLPGDYLQFPDSIGGVTTPGQLFEMVAAVLTRPSEITI